MALPDGYPKEMMEGGPTITVPRKGVVLPPSMIPAAARTRMRKGVHRVTDKIWVVSGASAAMVAVIDAPDGLIVCDSGDNAKEGGILREMIDAEIGKPVKAAIGVHSHFFLGTGKLGDDLMVITHPDYERSVEVMRRSGGAPAAIPEVGPILTKRAGIQFNQFMPDEGADGRVGIKMEMGAEWSVVPPTHTPSDRETINVCGLDIEFYTEGYSDDYNLTAYVPDMKAIICNNYVWGFTPNLYTLRGSTYRDPKPWLKGLKVMRSLDAELMLASAIKPIQGKEAVRDAINLFMDNLALIYDQTCRGILQGLTPDELRYSIYRPRRLANGPNNSELYGCICWYPSAIYYYQLGWNDLDGARLFQLPPKEEATRLVALVGSADTVLEAAQAALDKKEYAWAAQLCSLLQRADLASDPVKQCKAAALRQMGHLSPSSIGRAFLLTEALELEGKISLPTLFPPAAYVVAEDPDHYVDLFRVRIDPRQTERIDSMVVFEFPDKTCGLHIRMGVAEYVEDVDEHYKAADIHVRLSGETWAKLYLSQAGASSLAGELEFVKGNAGELNRLLALFDPFPTDVAEGEACDACDEPVPVEDELLDENIPA